MVVRVMWEIQCDAYATEALLNDLERRNITPSMLFQPLRAFLIVLRSGDQGGATLG